MNIKQVDFFEPFSPDSYRDKFASPVRLESFRNSGL